MKSQHVPSIDLRYWTAITLSSILGTNLGDLYAHKSGLGLMQGATLLAVLVAAVFVIERLNNSRNQVFYWTVILIIRTGATNVADYLAYIAKVPPVLLGLGVVALFVLFAWLSSRTKKPLADGSLASFHTGATYWLAMLSAGVLGTLAGDLCSDNLGQGMSSLGLFAVLCVVVALLRGHWSAAAAYWGIVAVARTAGTAIGDWIAENKVVEVGLTRSTCTTGLAFLAVLALWRSRRAEA